MLNNTYVCTYVWHDSIEQHVFDFKITNFSYNYLSDVHVKNGLIIEQFEDNEIQGKDRQMLIKLK